MERRPLGQTSLQVSRIALGTMTFGAQVDAAVAASIVDLCLDEGVNFIDTANVYQAGASEELLGRVLGTRRDRVVLATKAGIKLADRPEESGLSRNAIVKALDSSLQRLRTDYVDVFYLHQPDDAVPIEESLDAADSLVRAGKVRQAGISNYAGWQVCRMLWLAEKNSWQPVQVAQPMYNLLARGIEQEFLPMARQFGVSVVAYNPLAGGLLTGKHRSDVVPPGTRFERMPAYRDRYWNATNFEAVGRLSEIARSAGRSLIGLSLGWLLAQAQVTSVIVGVSHLDQLRQNLAAAHDKPLDSDTLVACDNVWSDLRGVAPRYNR